MQGDKGLFAEINNAILDLQGSQLQSFERPLKRLAQLLKDQDLEVTNATLTNGLDLDGFLAKASHGGMAGTDQLHWPDDQEKVLGLTLLLIYRFADTPRFMINFGHQFCSSSSSKIISSIHEIVRQIIIPFARDYRSYVLNKESSKPKLILPLSNKIFIVHGHDGEAREAIARFLSNIGFEPIILHEQANRGMTIIEKVEANSDVGFAVILLTPDDEGRMKGGELEPRPRQNVLLELGYFIGKLGRDRVCALTRGAMEIPSDFAGVVWQAMDENGGWKTALGRELQAAGYAIDWNKVMK